MDIYILKNSVKLGPYSEAKIRNLLDTGLVTDQDLGWCDCVTDWTPIGLLTVIPPLVQPTTSTPYHCFTFALPARYLS